MDSSQSLSLFYIKERLKEPEPITAEEIKQYNDFISKSSESNFLFDKTHTLQAVVQRLFQANITKPTEDFCEISSNGATKILDRSGRILFYSKPSCLSENLGVPKNEPVEREHLYYLLDHGNFAGVPPAFRVKVYDEIRSLHWFINNCQSFFDYPLERKSAARRCFIHQFRTVNMDPSSFNILIPKNDNAAIIPIDGGYSLPFNLTCNISFDIADNPPLKQNPYLSGPFTNEELEYIEHIDIESDIELIKKHFGKRPASSAEKDQKIFKIFRTANQILKIAADEFKKVSPENISITLHDICKIRDIDIFSEFKSISLFQTILEAENSIEKIHEIFSEILEIKKEILNDNENTPKNLALNCINKTKNQWIKKLGALYALGKKNYSDILESKEESTLKKELKKL